MSLDDVLRLLGRRWITFLSAVFLTAAVVIQVQHMVPGQYQATGQELFILPPQATGVETPTNPYLNLDSGMTTTASLIAGMVSTDDVRDQMAADGKHADYVVAVVPDSGPLLQFTVTGTDAQDVRRTRDALMDLVEARLAALQTEASVPDRQLMRATRPLVSKNAEPLHGNTIKATAAAGVGGLLLTLLLCLAVDRIGLFRRRRRERTAAALLADDVAVAVTKAKATRSRFRRGGARNDNDEPLVVEASDSRPALGEDDESVSDGGMTGRPEQGDGVGGLLAGEEPEEEPAESASSVDRRRAGREIRRERRRRGALAADSRQDGPAEPETLAG